MAIKDLINNKEFSTQAELDLHLSKQTGRTTIGHSPCIVCSESVIHSDKTKLTKEGVRNVCTPCGQKLAEEFGR